MRDQPVEPSEFDKSMVTPTPLRNTIPIPSRENKSLESRPEKADSPLLAPDNRGIAASRPKTEGAAAAGGRDVGAVDHETVANA